MKKLFLAGGITLSVFALAVTPQAKTASALQTTSISCYQDTIPKKDSVKWPPDTTRKRDSFNLR